MAAVCSSASARCAVLARPNLLGGAGRIGMAGRVDCGHRASADQLGRCRCSIHRAHNPDGGAPAASIGMAEPPLPIHDVAVGPRPVCAPVDRMGAEMVVGRKVIAAATAIPVSARRRGALRFNDQGRRGLILADTRPGSRSVVGQRDYAPLAPGMISNCVACADSAADLLRRPRRRRALRL